MNDNHTRVFVILAAIIAAAFTGLWLGWNAPRRLKANEEPHFPWVKIGSTNTVTITNTVTSYVLDIDIMASDGNETTQKMVLRHRLKDSSKPFTLEEWK